jgi:hypothetical protein
LSSPIWIWIFLLKSSFFFFFFWGVGKGERANETTGQERVPALARLAHAAFHLPASKARADVMQGGGNSAA